MLIGIPVSSFGIIKVLIIFSGTGGIVWFALALYIIASIMGFFNVVTNFFYNNSGNNSASPIWLLTVI